MAVQDAATLKGYFNTGDTPTEAQFADLVDSCIGSGVWGSVTGTLSDQTDLKAALDSKEVYHGVEASGTLSFDDSTHVVTLASGTNTYW